MAENGTCITHNATEWNTDLQAHVSLTLNWWRSAPTDADSSDITRGCGKRPVNRLLCVKLAEFPFGGLKKVSYCYC